MRIFKSCHHKECAHTWFRQEEIANGWTHLIALLLSIGGLIFLVHKATSTRDIVACSVYGASVIFMYSSSAIYHFLLNHRLKRVFHILDHISIFLMIAGSYTPFTLLTLHGPWGWSLFGVVWGIACLGIFFKLFFTGRFNLLSTALYALMGWIALIAIVPITRALPDFAVFLLVLGGVLYTVGMIFYLMESVPFAHTVWHLFVIGGWLTHFACIYFYVVQPGLFKI